MTNAVLHSNRMHDAVLPQSVKAYLSLLCHSRSSEQIESKGCVSITETDEKKVLEGKNCGCLGGKSASCFYFPCDFLCLHNIL